MSFDVEQFVRYRIANARMKPYPFSHFFVENVFPPDFYRELLDGLPDMGIYKPIGETGSVSSGGYRDRYVCELDDAVASEASAGIWSGLKSWIMSGDFTRLILGQFRPAIEERFGAKVKLEMWTDCRLVRDFTNYAIPPHTDTESKLVSLLFYLPRDTSRRHLGTSIYVPLDPEFRSDGNMHYTGGNFRHIARMDYLPNALFAFLRTDWSFHGVEPIADADVERNLMLYNIYVKNVLPSRKPETGLRWPWRQR